MITDMDQIKSLPHLFARGLDRRDAALIRSCFHPDGIDDHGMFVGNVDEFLTWVMEQLQQYERSQHHITTQTVKMNGDRAGCESYAYAHHVIPSPDGPLQSVVAGRYLDMMEKRDGVWKIIKRTFLVDWSELQPLSELPVPEGTVIHTGTSDGSDPSMAFFDSV